MKKKLFFIGIIFLMNACLVRFSFAEDIIRVGVLKIPPFAYQENGINKGLAIDLWSTIAKENKWNYRFVTIDRDVSKLLKELESNSLDVVIGNISVTNERLKLVDFSRPFYISQINLIVLEGSKSFFQLLKNLLVTILDYKVVLIALLTVSFLIISLMWWLERRKVDNVSERTGLFDHGWHVIVMFITGSHAGQQNTIAGRFLAATILCFSVVMSGMLVAALTSALTISLSKNQLTQLSDLGNRPVAVEKNSYEEQLAIKLGLSYISYPDFTSAINALISGKVVGVMDEAPSAHYYLQHHNDLNLVIAPFSLNYNEVAFSFQKKSPYIDAFNLSLTKIQTERRGKDICKIYIGDKDSDLCNL